MRAMLQLEALSSLNRENYFFTPRTASFAALATRNLTTVLAGILIFCCVCGLKPERAFLFFHELAKTGQNEFAVLFDLFVREVAKRIEEYSSGSFVGLGGSSECDLKFSFGHVWLSIRSNKKPKHSKILLQIVNRPSFAEQCEAPQLPKRRPLLRQFDRIRGRGSFWLSPPLAQHCLLE
jgi:hypothetical protein